MPNSRASVNSGIEELLRGFMGKAHALGFLDLVLGCDPLFIVGGEDGVEVMRDHQIRMFGDQLFGGVPEVVKFVELKGELAYSDLVVRIIASLWHSIGFLCQG